VDDARRDLVSPDAAIAACRLTFTVLAIRE